MFSVKKAFQAKSRQSAFYPVVGIGTPPPPPPAPGGGAHSQMGEGVGPNSDDWRKSLELCLFCGWNVFFLTKNVPVCVSVYGTGT
jgi:hypothetical protein